MNSQHPKHQEGADLVRFTLLYFLLATFVVAVLGGSLLLSSRLVGSFDAAVKVDAKWGELFFAIERLRPLSSAVNAPGNNLFESGSPSRERRNFEGALAEYKAQSLVVQQALQGFERALPGESLTIFTGLEGLITQMAGFSSEIFDLYERGDKERAVSSMALLDRTHSTLNQRISSLQEGLRKLQKSDFEAQHGVILEMKQYEAWGVFLIVLVVLSALLYGYGLSVHMKNTATIQRRLSAQINELYRPGKSGRQHIVPPGHEERAQPSL